MVPNVGKLHIEISTNARNPMFPSGAFLKVLKRKAES